MTTTVALSHGMRPEAAESAVTRALARHKGQPVVVLLNGFSESQWRVIRHRLPYGYAAHMRTPNRWRLTHPNADAKALTVFGANFDWADSLKADGADVRSLLDHGADAILGVELASTGHPTTRLADLLPAGWHVHQGAHAAAKSAVAVGPDHRVTGSGTALGIGHVPGIKLGVRDIEWSDVALDGRRVRLYVVHEPPHRFHQLWPLYTAHLVALIRTSPFPVIVGGDWNTPLSGVDIHKLSRLLGLRVYGVGIDGLLYSPSLVAHPAPAVTNADTRSDHPFPGATFTWA